MRDDFFRLPAACAISSILMSEIFHFERFIFATPSYFSEYSPFHQPFRLRDYDCTSTSTFGDISAYAA